MKVLTYNTPVSKRNPVIKLPLDEIQEQQIVKVVVYLEDDSSEDWDFWTEDELGAMGKTSGLKSTSFNA